jgi:putative tryptophan/tyrosine transport system substrate-binding protein
VTGHAMGRREFITRLSGVAAWPLAARAQQPAVPVIGYLSARAPETDVPLLAAFRRGLNETGYVEGKNVAIEYRWGGGQLDRLGALAEDLVRRQVNVIVTGGGEPVALAAKAATAKIPIVFNIAEDPVRFGLVASLNRPGGNLTGVTSLLGALGLKQLGLLRELVPQAAIIAMLVDPSMPWAESLTTNSQAAARSVGQQVVILGASAEREIDAAFATFVQQRAGGLLITASPFFFTRANYVIALAARHALPAVYWRREIAGAGGLMSYGSSTAELYGQVGVYAGKILNGTKPADLPIMQPTKYELVINLKTAKALGLEVPATLLARADEVIE